MSSDFKINDLQLKYLELETLLDITHELNSFDQISVLLQEILIKSCGVLNASSGLILIEDDNSDVLHIGAHFNIDISVLKGLIFNKRKGIISKINESRKALNITIEDDSFLDKNESSSIVILRAFRDSLILSMNHERPSILQLRMIRFYLKHNASSD